MRHFILFLVLSCLMLNCTPPMAEDSKKPVADQVEVDTTPRVTGIGGIFFKSADPGATKAWYSENLGMNVDDFGAPFEFRNANRPEEINYLNWDAFVDSTDYFDPSTKPFMINYRVHNLEGLVAKLKTNGVTILDELKVVEYGKFIHIQDNDGNKIELWEPVDSVLAGFGRKANK